MQDRLTEIILLGLAAIVGLFLLVAALDWLLPDAAPLGEWANVVLALVTIFAILFGGLFAAVKFDLFRDFEPRLSLSHTINHRRIGDSYVHLDITVNMHNSSRVKVDLGEGFWVLQQIAPIGDAEVEAIYSRDAEAGLQEFLWPVLDEGRWMWSRDHIAIEPGETYHELLEIILPNAVEAALIYTFCYNPNAPEKETGWSLGTVYDIID